MAITTWTLKDDEIELLKKIEEYKPEWKYFSTSQKVKALFYMGAEKLISEEKMQVQKGALLYAFVNSESYMAQAAA